MSPYGARYQNGWRPYPVRSRSDRLIAAFFVRLISNCIAIHSPVLPADVAAAAAAAATSLRLPAPTAMLRFPEVYFTVRRSP
jgi:hypothetical protein